MVEWTLVGDLNMFTFYGISVGRKVSVGVGRKDGRAGVRVGNATVTGGMRKNDDRNFHNPYPSTGPGITATNMRKRILGTAQGLMLTALMLGTAGAMSDADLTNAYLAGGHDTQINVANLVRDVMNGETNKHMETIMAIEEENKRLRRENEQILAEKEKADAKILELENQLLHKGGI
jgi:hypothetical protein